MLSLIPNLPENVVGLEAKGKVDGNDYETVAIPAVDEEAEKFGEIRFLYVLGEDFDGWTADAMWDDLKVCLKHGASFKKIALVSDVGWIRHTIKGVGWMVPGEMKCFGNAEIDQAKNWVAA